LVDIPVIGPGETGVHYASLLGNSFGVVTLKEEGFIQAWRDVINNSGLQSKAIANPVRGVGMSSYDVATKGIADVSLIVHAVEEKARELVNEGAEVVVIGCSLFSPLCTAKGLVNLDGNVPIVDVMAVSLKMAEFMVDLKKSIDLPTLSRSGRYQGLRDKDIRRLGAHFGMDTQSF
jgi:allantoin racemase